MTNEYQHLEKAKHVRITNSIVSSVHDKTSGKRGSQKSRLLNFAAKLPTNDMSKLAAWLALKITQ